MKWIAENPDTLSECSPANAVLQGWSRHDPNAATTWLLANATSSVMTARGISEIMLEQLYGQGIRAAGEWLASLPDTDDVNAARRMAWNSHLGRLVEISSEDAAAVWQAIGTQSWVGWKDFERFSGLVGAVNSGGDSAFLSALAGGGSPDAISSQFERWAATEPELTSGWLAKHSENSAFRTAAIRGLLRHLEKTDPEAAAVWRKQIPQ
jgi:hypothetical protein